MMKGGLGKVRMVIRMTAMLALVSGCSKELEFESVYKEDVIPKSIIDTNADYLYVPSAVEGDRNAPGGRPFWVGEQKMVRFRWTEEELQIVQVEPDERFKANPTNIKTILSIPVKHVDYRTKKDQFGDETNQEEEVTDVPFSLKGSFKPDIEGMSVKEVNLMPIELENLFDGGCYSETGSRLIGYELNQEGLLLQVERNYRANIGCVGIQELEDLFNLSFSARYTYSVVRMDKLRTPNYQTLEYPGVDSNTFGFFTTTVRKLAADNRDIVEGEKILMNRWSPTRKEIVYNLSSAFHKPENKIILDSTHEAVRRMNETLKKAGVDLQVRVTQDKNRVSGDLRHSEIVLIDDPLKVGLLGYGPSVADPYTGEILYARVAMYGGVIKQFIWREYDRLVQEELSKQVSAKSQLQVKLSDAVKSVFSPLAQNTTVEKQSEMKQEIVKLLHQRIAGTGKQKGKPVSFLSGNQVKNIQKQLDKIGNLTDEKMAKIIRYMKRPSDLEFRLLEKSQQGQAEVEGLRAQIAELDQVTALALMGAYPAELFNFQAAVKTGVGDIVGQNPKPWAELSEGEREVILEKMMPIVWIPTLIHEIGHTLGLRHNFSGSEDKANFYTEQELAAMGIERAIPYSSMMEYPASDLSALPVMGKYDIASLRFAYNREVELADGRISKVNTSLADMVRSGVQIRPYEYCSDEGADSNPNCNRFDEGTTFQEMAGSIVNMMEERYKTSGFKQGRRLFSAYNDINYAARVDAGLFELRQFFERYALITKELRFDPGTWNFIGTVTEEEAAAQGIPWSTITFLRGVKEGTEIAASYMLDNLLQPDLVCAVAQAQDPSTITGFVNLSDIAFGDQGLDCFDADVAEAGQVVIGQLGRAFLNRRATTNPSSYVDQIDVRGSYTTKLIALEQLLARQVGSPIFDARENMSFLDHPEVGPLLLDSLEKMMLNQAESFVTLEIPGGQSMSGFFKSDMEFNHRIPEPLDSRVSQVFGLRGTTHFRNPALKVISRLIPDSTDRAGSQAIANRFAVIGVSVVDSGKLNGIPDLEKVEIGDMIFAARTQNTVARAAIEGLKIREILDPMFPAPTTQEEADAQNASLQKIVSALTDPNFDQSTLTPEEKVVVGLGMDKVVRYFNAEIATSKYLKDLLITMPRL